MLGPAWEDVDFDAGTALVRRASVSVDGRGQQLGNLVFTNPTGGLVLRQAVAKIVEQAGKTAGIAAELGTHTGRRTVVTTPFVDGDEAVEDIARFVGHARPATTAGYVKCLGRRPHAVAQRAAAFLDGDDPRGARPEQANPMVDRRPRSEGISRTVVHRPGLLRGAGGNR